MHNVISLSKVQTRSNYHTYLELIGRIQDVAFRTLPPAAVVAVISKGDERLLELPQLRGWHFPRQDDGSYAGYYPIDSAAAIAHLEGLRDRGADFLLIPATALWWLDYYTEFRQHLEARYRTVLSDDALCRVFALRDTPRGSPSQSAAQLRYQGLTAQVRSVVRGTLPPDASVLVVSKGDEALLQLDARRTAHHFLQDNGGGYSGHHPRDSMEAIDHLEADRARGAQYLLIPSPQFWWLAYYTAFRRHLEERYRLAVCQRQVCVIFELREASRRKT